MADPAFRGFVESTLDALLIFEGCKRGFLPKITRRLQEFEKRQNVVSGAVFVFDEEETGIKRWTDGLSWSPSRTLANFLVYRELDKKAQPPPAGAGAATTAEDDDGEGGGGGGGPGRAAAAGGSSGGGGSVRSRLMGGLTSKADPIDEQDAAGAEPVASGSGSRPGSSSARRRSSVSDLAGATLDRARERALVGSLTSSYRFRSDGLVKKTISLQGLHLIGYYRIDDVVSGRLRTPSSHHELNALEVSSHFLTPSLYRIPPLVEIGPDGHLKYKGEADAPMSPLTRSGSSQGLPTPAGPHSRPASASNASDQFGHPLPPVGGPWDHPLATPTSPRRSAHSGFRTNNRFDPYGSSTRFSPSHYAPPSSGAYPFPPVGPGQPAPRATYTTMGESSYEAGGAYFQERTPPVDGTSSSAPHMSGGWHGPHGGAMYPPGSTAGEYAHDGVPAPPSSSFYQPRHSIPFAPTSDASSSGGIFAYNPPPAAAGSQGPGAQQYRAPHTASGAYAAYHRPYSAQQPPHALAQAHGPPPSTAPSYGAQLSPTETQSHSPFATPPSTGHVGRAPHPGQLNLSHASSVPPSQSSSSLPSPVPPLGYSSHGRTNGPIVEPTSSLASHAASLMAEVSPHSPADAVNGSRMQQQQQQAMRSMYAAGGGPSASSYPAPPPPAPYSGYDPAPRGSYGYQGAPPPQQAQAQQQQQHPSGLVVPGPIDEVVPASGHGLGVSAYGEIVPAAQVGDRGAPPGYAQLPCLHSVGAAGGLGLSSQHAYAPPPPPGGYDARGQQGPAAGPPPQQYSAQHVGRVERDGLERAPVWAVKREPPDPHTLLHQPLSPPMQPQRSLGQHEQYHRHHQQQQQHGPPPPLPLPPPPQQQQQQQQAQPGWWAGGEDPWQQGVAQRQAQTQEYQQA